MSGSAFTKEQYNKIYPDGIGNHYWNHARNRIISRALKKFNLNSGKILEIGCGRGIVLDFLRKKEMNCFGVELGDADPLTGIREYIYTNTNAFGLPAEMRQSIDTVLLFDVIEHLEDQEEFIQEISRKFGGTKHLVITVPARQELWTNYDEFNGHFRRYNLADLKNLNAPGIQLREASYFNHLLYPVFWMYARIIKRRSMDIKAPSGLIVLFHTILSVILQIDFLLFPRHLPGTSIIAVFSMTDSQ